MERSIFTRRVIQPEDLLRRWEEGEEEGEEDDDDGGRSGQAQLRGVEIDIVAIPVDPTRSRFEDTLEEERRKQERQRSRDKAKMQYVAGPLLLVPLNVRRDACAVFARHFTRSVGNICRFIQFVNSLPYEPESNPEPTVDKQMLLFGDTDMLVDMTSERILMTLPMVCEFLGINDQDFAASSSVLQEELETLSTFLPRLLDMCPKAPRVNEETCHSILSAVHWLWEIDRIARFVGRLFSGGEGITRNTYKAWTEQLSTEEKMCVAKKISQFLNKYAESCAYFYPINNRDSVENTLESLATCKSILDGHLTLPVLQSMANRIRDSCFHMARQGKPMLFSPPLIRTLRRLFENHLELLQDESFREATGLGFYDSENWDII